MLRNRPGKEEQQKMGRNIYIFLFQKHFWQESPKNSFLCTFQPSLPTVVLTFCHNCFTIFILFLSAYTHIHIFTIAPSLGTSICHRCSLKKTKQNKQTKKSDHDREYVKNVKKNKFYGRKIFHII